ncbi:MAG: nucleoside-diphosphate kinase [Limisphaerales bacterium]
MDTLEATLILIKPDALERGLTGEIIRRLEQAGLRLLNTRWVRATREKLERHYADLKAKNPRAFDRNSRYLTDKSMVALVFSGANAIAKARVLVGPTEPASAPAGTIRGDLSSDSIAIADGDDRGLYNLVHAADSRDAARREIDVWFTPET